MLKHSTSHQCGTVKFGHDPKTSALDQFCRSHDHSNLFVIDASFMPSSAAVNPSLTIAANAFRAADHILKEEFGIDVTKQPEETKTKALNLRRFREALSVPPAPLWRDSRTDVCD
ncbi:gluconate dehydrogenase [Pseudomonas putida S11]|nr:gluconate dehydrogenase [Pseudomonas putida S11]